MRILFLGDIVGREGRDAVIAQLPALKSKYNPDATIINGENAASGNGITPQICDDLYKAGVDVITTGNHVWDQQVIIPYINNSKKLVRPANYPEKAPGKGYTIIETAKGQKILVINVMGRLFMEALDSPFDALEKILSNNRLGFEVSAIVVDLHAEASSEKMIIGHYLDGRVSLVVGTHTHIPTADAQILGQGTAYITDAGMCGAYDSVIGFNKEIAINRFVTKVPHERMAPAAGAATLCGVLLDVDNKSGLATKIQPLIMGARLKECLPE